MQKLYRFFLISGLVLLLVSFEAGAQTARNPVLEYVTGTWCQYCPCGHTIIHDVIMLYNPNTIVLGYHGPSNSSDPYRIFNGNNIISLMGFNSYPTGIIDRLTGPQSRSAWAGQVSNRSAALPKVSIEGTIGYEADSNKLHVNLTIKALEAIAEIPAINFIVTEDKLISTQTGNSGCPGNGDYVHNNVVRSILNGALGNELAKSGWAVGDSAVVDTFYYLPANITKVSNTNLNVFVYSKKASLNLSEIHQARKWKITDFPVGVKDSYTSGTPSEFALQQNYPNPFNPETSINFSVPKSGFVSLKIFDLLGKEVATIVNGELASGNYIRVFNANELPSGVYIYRLEAEGTSISRKMNLLK